MASSAVSLLPSAAPSVRQMATCTSSMHPSSSSVGPSQNQARPRAMLLGAFSGRRLEVRRAEAVLTQQRFKHRWSVLSNWNAEVSFDKVGVAEREEVAEGLHKLVLDVSDLGNVNFEKPGQYVQLKVGDSKPAFIAIASPPRLASNGSLEFLIKNTGDGTAALLCNLSKGAGVEMSPVMGKGFNVDRLKEDGLQEVILFATGSGISPIRSLIEEGVLAGKPVKARLYWGAKTPEHIPYQDKFATWETEGGIFVVPVLSQADSLPTDWPTAAKGYVQDAYAAGTPISDPEVAAAVLCGQKAMAEAVKELLRGQGVKDENFLLNF